MLTEASRPDVVSFALGLPAPELFPAEDLADLTSRILSADRTALQYSPAAPALVEQVVALMRVRGVECDASQVFLTTGAQQGLSLLARVLLVPGACVLLETLVYPGMRQVLEPFEPFVLEVPTDTHDGIDVDAIEQHLERDFAVPRFIYVMSDGHNPHSVSMSRDKRMRLAALARHYRVPIVEDDAYGFLSYDTPEPPVRAYDDEWVLYVGSFSKTIAPGLRLGWLIVPEPLQVALSVAKEASDINTATLSQRIVAAYLGSGKFTAHVEQLRREYRARRDAMEAALQQRLSTHAEWRTPSSGVFLWVRVPGVDADQLLRVALTQERVAFVPGEAFAAHECTNAREWLRLNFSHCSPATIAEGIERLARAHATIEPTEAMHEPSFVTPARGDRR
jgi:2-aminoadipate transaminase